MNRFESFQARCAALMSKGKVELAQLVAAIEHGFSHPDFHPFGEDAPAVAAPVARFDGDIIGSQGDHPGAASEPPPALAASQIGADAEAARDTVAVHGNDSPATDPEAPVDNPSNGANTKV